jgi:hypothetical protein
MANPTITDVEAFETAVLADLATLPILGNILDRRRAIANRQDYFAKLAIEQADQNEIVFCELEFLHFEDSPDEGDDDCPVLIVTYGVHVFRQFVDLRSDDSNSSQDFKNAIFSIRKFFLESNREYSAGDFLAIVDPLLMPDFAQFGNDTFTDAVGHVGDLNLTVRFYDE